jgi:hypothetical protein
MVGKDYSKYVITIHGLNLTDLNLNNKEEIRLLNAMLSFSPNNKCVTLKGAIAHEKTCTNFTDSSCYLDAR